MASLFSGPKMPSPPGPTRMPAASDPDVLAAGRRTREAALKRTGRLSTIMTDTLRQTGGDYGGSRLGAQAA